MVEGAATAVIVRTGDNTVIARIAHMSVAADAPDSTLTIELNKFIKAISVVAISIGLIFLIVGFAIGRPILENLVFTIGIIVAEVPEGLLPTVTGNLTHPVAPWRPPADGSLAVSLTVTARRLASRNVLVKQLSYVETLGSCTVIASDKTGTLTQNRMTLVHLFYDGKLLMATGAGNFAWNKAVCVCRQSPRACACRPHRAQDLSFQYLHKVICLCNRASFVDPAQAYALAVAHANATASLSAVLLRAANCRCCSARPTVTRPKRR